MLLKFVLKNLVSRKRRSIVSLAGISISIALFMSIILILKSAQAAFKKPLEDAGADMTVQAQGEPCVWSIIKLPTNLNPITLETVNKIRAVKGVATVEGALITWAFSNPPVNASMQPPMHENMETTPMQETGASPQDIKNRIQTGELKGQPCDHGSPGSFCGTGEGAGAYNMPDYSPIVTTGVSTTVSNIGPIKTEDLKNIEGKFISKEDSFETVLDKDFAASRKLKVGDNIALGQRTFKIAGIIQTGRDAKIAGAQAFVPLNTLIHLVGRGDIVDIVFIKLKSDADAKYVKSKIQGLLPDNATITTSDDYLKTLAGISNFTHSLMLAIISIVILICLLFLIKTSLGSVLERANEIGLLKALGWRDKTISNMVILESLILGLLGGIIGAGLGYLGSLIYKANLTSVLPYYLNPYPPCSQQVSKNILHNHIVFSPHIFIFAVVVA
ncbi:MAG: ABC transporter permease, partial [Candidatus Omnitrophica bacterium]|nr:ABC transporter permease [Candidatus Omnitrophota bacterium]